MEQQTPAATIDIDETELLREETEAVAEPDDSTSTAEASAQTKALFLTFKSPFSTSAAQNFNEALREMPNRNLNTVVCRMEALDILISAKAALLNEIDRFGMRKSIRNGYRCTTFEIADAVRDALKRAAEAAEIVDVTERAAERLQVLCRLVTQSPLHKLSRGR